MITQDDLVKLPAGALLDYFFEAGSTPGPNVSVGESICWCELGFHSDVLELVESYRQLEKVAPKLALHEDASNRIGRILTTLAKRAEGVRMITAELQRIEGGAT